MNTPRTSILNPSRLTSILAAACLALSPAAGIAHGGLEHIMGTVSKVSASSLTVATTAGKSVEIALDEKTTYFRMDQPITRTGIKVGDRVVIHAAKNGGRLVAHTIKAGTAAADQRRPAKGPAPGR
jgi:Cu/Ag efflux protein CusF